MAFGMIPKPVVSVRSTGHAENDATKSFENGQQFPNALRFIKNNISQLRSIVVFKPNPAFGCEEYVLSAAGSSVSIEAADDAGAFYAAVTLKQLLDNEENLDGITISDKPRYSHRGLMIDECRHFFGREEIMKILDIMSMLKMNRFHWHLSDDQGYRIESKKYPKLNETGSWRAHKYLGDFMVRAKGDRYGGYYTTDEIRDIVTYAAQRNIEIIPEVDLPGHSRAILASYPQAGCRDFNTSVWSKAGISSEIICCGKSESMKLVFDLLTEVCELFPFSMFHIGGDEAIHKHWKKCPDCQKLMREKSFTNEKQLQSYFSSLLSAHLKRNGKNAVIWNDGLTADMDENVICQFWNIDKAAETKAAIGGRKLIYSPTIPFYLDNRYSKIPTQKILAFNEEDYCLHIEQNDVLGIEACVWTEWLNDSEMLEYALFPRLAAVAEVAWAGTENIDSAGFTQRLDNYQEKLFMNTNYCVLDYIGAPKGFEKRRNIKQLFGSRGFEYQENLIIKKL